MRSKERKLILVKIFPQDWVTQGDGAEIVLSGNEK